MTAPDRFTCEDVFRRLDDYLDRELSDEESARLREHLEVCAQCATEYRFESRVLRDVRQKLRRLQVPEDLQDKIGRMLARERRPSTGSSNGS